MNEGGASEITPIVHDGIMFLSNTGNTVQALDAKTGELIWENRIGPVASRAYSGTRSLALYEDKVYRRHHRRQALRAGCAHRQDRLEDRRSHAAKSSETGGVIVIHGKVLVGLTGLRQYAVEQLLYQRL